MMKFKYYNKLDVTEEELFSELNHYLLRKNNRIMNNAQVEQATGISKELIYKWVKMGKLNANTFPNIGCPCDRCGQLTTKTKICISCTRGIVRTLEQEEKDREWHRKINTKDVPRKSTYHSRR